MSELVIPLTPDLAGPVDEDYTNRRELVAAAVSELPFISSRARVIGSLANRETFSTELNLLSLSKSMNRQLVTTAVIRQTCDLELPFKVDRGAGLASYDLPDEIDQFSEAIGIMARYEHNTFPDARYRGKLRQAAHLSIDQSIVSPGEAQRSSHPGEVHRDGFKQHWQHIYVVTDRQPTEFFEWGEPGVAGKGYDIDPAKLGQPFAAEKYEITFANSTSLHRSPVIEAGGQRTFVRLAYTHDV